VLATKTLSRGFVLSQSTFHLVIVIMSLPRFCIRILAFCLVAACALSLCVWCLCCFFNFYCVVCTTISYRSKVRQHGVGWWERQNACVWSSTCSSLKSPICHFATHRRVSGTNWLNSNSLRHPRRDDQSLSVSVNIDHHHGALTHFSSVFPK